MFKKLYKNLLILNISILSLLLLVIFTSLYLSTYSDIQTRIQEELNRIVSPTNISHLPFQPDGNFDGDERVNNLERLGSFILLIQDGEVVEVISEFTFSDDLLDSVFEDATGVTGTVTFNDDTWSYLKTSDQNGEAIAYINTTIEYELLNDALQRYIIIFVISIIVTAIVTSFMTRRSIKPVKESFDKQKQFVSDASHELKTPLTVINTNVDILISEDKTDNKWLKYIKSEVTRMSKLTHDLLYLSNMTEVEKRDVIKTEFNVSEKIESIVLGTEALAFENNVNLQSDIKENLTITFNQEQFHQVVMVLIDNAIKYTNKQGDIHITLTEQNNYVYLKVRNTGKGIKEEHLKHIFDRFYKVDQSREIESNSFGLGLPIAKSICENNNAKLSVHSEVDNYTEFTIKVKQSHK